MKTRIFAILFLLVFVTGCKHATEINLQPSNASTRQPQAATSAALFPTGNPPASPTSSHQPAQANQEPTHSVLAAGTPAAQFVLVYLIALEDDGQSGIPVGCGDSAVPVQVEIQPTQAVLKAALEELLSIKSQYYGESGLYNALYQADLSVDSVNISGGKGTVYLTGSLNLGGVCDNPRLQAQLEQTVLQFPTVTEADIFINGKSLADAISLKN